MKAKLLSLLTALPLVAASGLAVAGPATMSNAPAQPAAAPIQLSPAQMDGVTAGSSAFSVFDITATGPAVATFAIGDAAATVEDTATFETSTINLVSTMSMIQGGSSAY